MSANSNPLVLHFAPHPDDECLGVGGGLLQLAAQGFRVINVACSLGKDDDIDRRRDEVTRACAELGIELLILEPRIKYSRNDDRAAAESALTERVRALIQEYRPSIIVSPSPHDRHHGHELVARAVHRGAELSNVRPLCWWMWGLWSDLPIPNVLIPLSASTMEQVERALMAHAGELDRNDYTRLLRGRAIMNSCVGYERVYGFGSARGNAEYLELVMEVVLQASSTTWLLTHPHDISESARISSQGINRWLARKSLTTQQEAGILELE